jgi:hypothetical protein
LNHEGATGTKKLYRRYSLRLRPNTVRRILLDLATVTSLLLCVVTVLLWARSHWYDDAFGWRNGNGDVCCASSMLGEILITRTVDWRWDARPLIRYRGMRVSDFERGRLGKGPYLGYYWRGFQWSHTPDRPGNMTGESYGVRVPHWFVAAVLLALPAGRLVRRWQAARRKGRRTRHGRCGDCGYDLRGTPHRCPECGAIPAATIPAATTKERGKLACRRD